jgi:hypothetical protein
VKSPQTLGHSLSKKKGYDNTQQACERESTGRLLSMTRFFWQSLKSALVFQKKRDHQDAVRSQPGSSHVTLVISPKKLALVLILLVLGLIAAHVGTRYLLFFQGHEYQLGFERQLNLDKENNIPTWYSSSALLVSAILLTVTGLTNKQRGNPYTYHWLGLAAIFLFLSLDESASLHEMTHGLLRPQLGGVEYLGGFLYFSWVVFGAIFVLIVGAIYLPFVVALPVQTRRLFLIAGTLYVGGELGIEILGARQAYSYGYKTFSYAMLVACEEGFAMLGNVVFIYGLLTHLGSSMCSLRILVKNGAPKLVAAVGGELSSPEPGQKRD